MSRKKEGNAVRSALGYSQMGLELALTVGIVGWAGHEAETRWGFAPWGMVGGILLGAALGLTRFLLVAFRMPDDGKETTEKEKTDKAP